MPSDAKLVRRLSLTDSILLLAGGIIGSGIFLTAKDVAINTRHPWLFLTVWVVGMGMALLACFAFAELGGMFPHAGGQYVYMREAYGDTAGFLYGWMYFTVSATGTVAALGVGFATYLGQTFPALHAEQVILPLRFVDITRGHLIALAAIALQTLINIFGVKKGAILQNVATWAKFGAIGTFVVGGLLLGRGSWDHFRHSLVPSGNEHVSIATGVGIALIAVFWAYDGWVYVTFVGGEIKDPQRNVPRALIWGLILVGVVYISINAVYIYALPMNEIAAQEAVAQTAAVSMFSGRVAPWLSMMVALSCFGAMAPCLMSGARVYYAMAEDGIFFHALAKVHPRWHTPVMSLVLQAIWAGVLALSGKYDELFTYVMFMMVLSYVLTVVGLFVLRRKKPDVPRPYRCTGYPVLPAIYVVLGSLWAINAAVEKRKETLVGTAIVLLGVPFYLWWKRQRKADAARELVGALEIRLAGCFMNFQNFDLEYFQSQFERTVEINLADSSVKCANVSDLLAGEDPSPLLELPLYYPEVNGTTLLRERIAALYPNTSAANVLVTVGAAQANWMVCNTLLEQGDEVIVVSPGYRQVWGLAKNTGCRVKETHLRPENNWRLDMDELESLAGPKTKADFHCESEQSNRQHSVARRDGADREHLQKDWSVAARG